MTKLKIAWFTFAREMKGQILGTKQKCFCYKNFKAYDIFDIVNKCHSCRKWASSKLIDLLPQEELKFFISLTQNTQSSVIYN